MENLQNKQNTVLENGEPTFIENTPQAQPVKKVQHRSYRYIFGALVALVVISGAVALFAMQSIPGDTLYTTKTSFLEPLVEKAQLSNKNKTFYQVTLMKHRLKEVQALAKKEKVDDMHQQQLSASIDTHTASLKSLVEASIDSAFPKTEMLFVLNDFASVAGAIEHIGENGGKLQQVGDTAENARSASATLYKKRAQSLVQTEAQTDVYTYIAEQLRIVKENLGKQEMSKETTRKVELYLNRVDPAIAKGDLIKVILSLAEANRIIETLSYTGISTEADVSPISPNTSTTTPQATTTETITP